MYSEENLAIIPSSCAYANRTSYSFDGIVYRENYITCV